MLKELGDTLYGVAAIQAAIPTLAKDSWDKATVLADYLLVIVGALGILYAGLTLGKLKEQATAAKVAAEKAAIDSGSKFLWLCGIARYRDVFEPKRNSITETQEHQTFVCVRYVSGFTPWVLDGPPGCNRAT